VRTKYHDLSAEDMAYLAEWNRLKSFREGRMFQPEAAFMREMMDKAQKSYSSGGMKGFNHEAGVRLMAIRSNELDNTAAAGAALEWVPTLWSADFWRRVRVDNNVASAFRSIEMPSNVFELPIESTDPTVYKVPETTGETQLALDNSNNPIPDSLVSSGKKTLTAAKLGLRVGFSTEMEEDSIIPFIAETREQGVRAMENAIDSVLLNGDTDATINTNINDIDGTPAATAKYLVFNGLRKLGLVTNTAVSLNAQGAAPTLQLIRSLRFKLQSALNVYALYPDNLVMFCDPYTYGRILNIDEVNVWINNGREATVNTGQVKQLDGVPIFPSAELALANTAGKISETASNNTTGTIVIAARSGWTIGYRRQITTSVDFLPYYDSYQFTATLRLAFINKDTVAAATMYNVAI
jgi:HK97 family phage major capsid protein